MPHNMLEQFYLYLKGNESGLIYKYECGHQQCPLFSRQSCLRSRCCIYFLGKGISISLKLDAARLKGQAKVSEWDNFKLIPNSGLCDPDQVFFPEPLTPCLQKGMAHTCLRSFLRWQCLAQGRHCVNMNPLCSSFLCQIMTGAFHRHKVTQTASLLELPFHTLCYIFRL